MLFSPSEALILLSISPSQLFSKWQFYIYLFDDFINSYLPHQIVNSTGAQYRYFMDHLILGTHHDQAQWRHYMNVCCIENEMEGRGGRVAERVMDR